MWSGVKNHHHPRKFHFITDGTRIVVASLNGQNYERGLSIGAESEERDRFPTQWGVLLLGVNQTLHDLEIAGIDADEL